MTHPLDQAIALTPSGPDTFTGATSPNYANMVGPFGGVIASVLLQAPLLHPSRLGDPVALTVNFAGPIADGAFTITARAARTNRSTQHWIMELRQGDLVGATATAVFAARRDTWSTQEARPPSPMPPAEQLPRFTAARRITWARCYDMRFAEGELPIAMDGIEQPEARSRLWVRDDPPRPLDFPALAALCDSFFPRIYIKRRVAAPIGTVSLTCFFHADAAALASQGERAMIGTARATRYHNGYFDQSAELWTDDGLCLANSHQIVYYRD